MELINYWLFVFIRFTKRLGLLITIKDPGKIELIPPI